MSQFIGRGEPTTELILGHLFGQANVISQYPLRGIIPDLEEYTILDDEVKKHKFDFKVDRFHDTLIIEVNYKHGAKADKKWNKVFTPMIKRADMIPVVIEDNSCESLFKDEYHPFTLGDWVDVLQALIDAGVEL